MKYWLYQTLKNILNLDVSKAITLAILKARGHDIEKWKRVW